MFGDSRQRFGNHLPMNTQLNSSSQLASQFDKLSDNSRVNSVGRMAMPLGMQQSGLIGVQPGSTTRALQPSSARIIQPSSTRSISATGIKPILATNSLQANPSIALQPPKFSSAVPTTVVSPSVVGAVSAVGTVAGGDIVGTVQSVQTVQSVNKENSALSANVLQPQPLGSAGNAAASPLLGTRTNMKPLTKIDAATRTMPTTRKASQMVSQNISQSSSHTVSQTVSKLPSPRPGRGSLGGSRSLLSPQTSGGVSLRSPRVEQPYPTRTSLQSQHGNAGKGGKSQQQPPNSGKGSNTNATASPKKMQQPLFATRRSKRTTGSNVLGVSGVINKSMPVQTSPGLHPESPQQSHVPKLVAPKTSPNLTVVRAKVKGISTQKDDSNNPEPKKKPSYKAQLPIKVPFAAKNSLVSSCTNSIVPKAQRLNAHSPTISKSPTLAKSLQSPTCTKVIFGKTNLGLSGRVSAKAIAKTKSVDDSKTKSVDDSTIVCDDSRDIKDSKLPLSSSTLALNNNSNLLNSSNLNNTTSGLNSSINVQRKSELTHESLMERDAKLKERIENLRREKENMKRRSKKTKENEPEKEEVPATLRSILMENEKPVAQEKETQDSRRNSRRSKRESLFRENTCKERTEDPVELAKGGAISNGTVSHGVTLSLETNTSERTASLLYNAYNREKKNDVHRQSSMHSHVTREYSDTVSNKTTAPILCTVRDITNVNSSATSNEQNDSVGDIHTDTNRDNTTSIEQVISVSHINRRVSAPPILHQIYESEGSSPTKQQLESSTNPLGTTNLLGLTNPLGTTQEEEDPTFVQNSINSYVYTNSRIQNPGSPVSAIPGNTSVSATSGTTTGNATVNPRFCGVIPGVQLLSKPPTSSSDENISLKNQESCISGQVGNQGSCVPGQNRASSTEGSLTLLPTNTDNSQPALVGNTKTPSGVPNQATTRPHNPFNRKPLNQLNGDGLRRPLSNSNSLLPSNCKTSNPLNRNCAPNNLAVGKMNSSPFTAFTESRVLSPQQARASTAWISNLRPEEPESEPVQDERYKVEYDPDALEEPALEKKEMNNRISRSRQWKTPLNTNLGGSTTLGTVGSSTNFGGSTGFSNFSGNVNLGSANSAGNSASLGNSTSGTISPGKRPPSQPQTQLSSNLPKKKSVTAADMVSSRLYKQATASFSQKTNPQQLIGQPQATNIQQVTPDISYQGTHKATPQSTPELRIASAGTMNTTGNVSTNPVTVMAQPMQAQPMQQKSTRGFLGGSIGLSSPLGQSAIAAPFAIGFPGFTRLRTSGSMGSLQQTGILQGSTTGMPIQQQQHAATAPSTTVDLRRSDSQNQLPSSQQSLQSGSQPGSQHQVLQAQQMGNESITVIQSNVPTLQPQAFGSGPSNQVGSPPFSVQKKKVLPKTARSYENLMEVGNKDVKRDLSVPHSRFPNPEDEPYRDTSKALSGVSTTHTRDNSNASSTGVANGFGGGVSFTINPSGIHPSGNGSSNPFNQRDSQNEKKKKVSIKKRAQSPDIGRAERPFAPSSRIQPYSARESLRDAREEAERAMGSANLLGCNPDSINPIVVPSTSIRGIAINTHGKYKPAPRAYHASAMVDGFLWVYGGAYRTDFGCTPFDDLWALNVMKQSWVQHRHRDRTPGPRCKHSMVAWRQYLVLFGGWDGSRRCNDVWYYDTIKHRWREIRDKQNPKEAFDPVTTSLKMRKERQTFHQKDSTWPTPHTSHACCVVDDDIMVVIGRGETGTHKKYGCDIDYFDLYNEIWILGGAKFNSRAGHSMTPISDGRILLFGGRKDNGIEIFRYTELHYCPFPSAVQQSENGGIIPKPSWSVVVVDPSGNSTDSENQTSKKRTSKASPVKMVMRPIGPPLGRSFHGCVTLVPGHLHLYHGGFLEGSSMTSRCLFDATRNIVLFDEASASWYELSPDSGKEDHRTLFHQSESAKDGTDTAVLNVGKFGALDPTQIEYLENVQMLPPRGGHCLQVMDMDSNWNWVNPKTTAPNIINPKAGAKIYKRLVLFAGHHCGVNFDDTWLLDLELEYCKLDTKSLMYYEQETTMDDYQASGGMVLSGMMVGGQSPTTSQGDVGIPITSHFGSSQPVALHFEGKNYFLRSARSMDSRAFAGALKEQKRNDQVIKAQKIKEEENLRRIEKNLLRDLRSLELRENKQLADENRGNENNVNLNTRSNICYGSGANSSDRLYQDTLRRYNEIRQQLALLGNSTTHHASGPGQNNTSSGNYNTNYNTGNINANNRSPSTGKSRFNPPSRVYES